MIYLISMEKLKILIIGSGGREHAIGWKVAQSARAGALFFTPGNAGTATLGTNVDIAATDIPALLDFAKKEHIDLTLALPDDPLALGIVDTFRAAGLRIFGPTKTAAQLESSKAFAKDFMARNHLPTAEFKVFTDYDAAKNYVIEKGAPIVVKASGLALGKGVVVAMQLEEALEALETIFIKKAFGDAGKTVVIEAYMTGPEISTHAFSDGTHIAVFPTAQDHKRVGEGDTGPNTGGMGTIAPLPFVTDTLFKNITDTIIATTVHAMELEKNPFEGVLYPGLMLTAAGPKILEYNARFGDPETQSYMRLLDTDILDIFEACIDKTLATVQIKWKNLFACTIVLASGGYPGNYEKGKIISGITEAEALDGVVVFHAGTKRDGENIITNGGRVLGVSATGETLEQALQKAYTAITKISFAAMQYRTDIGKNALQLSK